MKLARILIPIALLTLAGCSKNIQTNEAVRKGVVDYLSKNSNIQVSGMDIEISNATFKDNACEALVSFKPKGGPAESGMQMRYTLERKGNEWVVKGKADSGAGHSGMPAAGEMPPSGGGMGEMPPGHPPTDAGAGAGKKQ